MSIQNTQEKFLHELGDIYDAENRFLKGQQEMLQNATDTQLQNMLQQHIQQTQQHVTNIQQAFQTMNQQPKATTCQAAQGLVAEAQNSMQEAGTPEIRDCLIAAAADRVEHYEIAAYTGLITGSQMMGQTQVTQLLQQNLQQEQQTAQLIEQTAPTLLQNAMQAEGTQPKGSTNDTATQTQSYQSTNSSNNSSGSQSGSRNT